MARLVWDDHKQKMFEGGLDRGVLYASHQRGRAWNGLIGLHENPADGEVVPFYQDGQKQSQRVTPHEYSATLEAYTYPDQFLDFNSEYGQVAEGLYVDEQAPRPFGLSYRTMVGDSASGPKTHYKIHLLYNAIAMPNTRPWETFSDDPSLMPFVWDITTTPVYVPHMRPASHFIVDSYKTDPGILTQIENRLYGTSSRNPSMLSPQELVELYTAYNISPYGYGYGPYGLTTYGHGQEV